MKAETWNLLNGQGFGELPERDMELEIPDFMVSRAYAVPEVPVSAYCGQAAGRVKRRQHLTERSHRRSKNATFWMAVGFALLVLAVNLPEWIF